MKKKIILWPCILALLATTSGFAQQSIQKSESGKFRTIFTIGGAGGGFVLGLGGGLAAFDDAINSNRKVWMTAILAGVGGGIGGYFLGRALDMRGAKTTWRHIPDPLDRGLVRHRLAEAPTRPFGQMLLLGLNGKDANGPQTKSNAEKQRTVDTRIFSPN
jgi:hypothetical protein